MSSLHLIAHTDPVATAADARAVALPNDADPFTLPLDGVTRIDLHFPKFTDGRAYSQAFLLRRRRGFTGEIRATGDVLIDQLVQMQRTGFSSAVLRADQDLAHGRKLMAHYAGFYQGDAVHVQPHFAEQAAEEVAGAAA